VAPRRIDQRLLAKPARATSARVILALVLAALLLAGCGGGSSDGSSSTASAAEASSGSVEGSHSDGSDAKTQGVNGSAGAGGGSASGSNANGAQHTAATKHGPHVPQPTGAPEPKITPQQHQEATVVTMSLESPDAITGGGQLKQLPAKYTCNGANTWPTLRWNGTPAGTAELALFVMNVQPVEGRLFFDWAVSGIEPGRGEIETGKLPKGTVVGRNSFGKNGYSVCPPGQGEVYMFALYAMPEKVSASSGFDPGETRKKVLDVSGNAGLMALSYGQE